MTVQELQKLRFYQEELFDAKSQLFSAKNVKQVKFLQDRISFLSQKIDDIQERAN
jgi:hypothetical protein